MHFNMIHLNGKFASLEHSLSKTLGLGIFFGRRVKSTNHLHLSENILLSHSNWSCKFQRFHDVFSLL